LSKVPFSYLSHRIFFVQLYINAYFANHKKLAQSTKFETMRPSSKKKLTDFLFRILPVEAIPIRLLVVGSQKAGTTSLHSYLGQHPCLVSPKMKEIQFFWRDDMYELGTDWYAKHFYKFRKKMEQNVAYQAFDATPDNLYFPAVAQRIKDYKADMRIVIILREPVSRAYSAWNMYKQLYVQYQKIPFIDVGGWLTPAYIKNATSNLRNVLFADSNFPTFEAITDLEKQLIAEKSSYLEPSFLRRGFYAEQIARYYEHFPKEQILILTNKDLKQNVTMQLNRILTFLDLPPHDWQNLDQKQKNVHAYDEPMSEKTRQDLTQFYEPHNEQLFELLGYKPNW